MKNHWKTKKNTNLTHCLNYWLFGVKRLGASLAQSIPKITLSCIQEFDALMDQDEAKLLNISTRESRIRLIKHHHGEKIFVFGRTIIPQKTYSRYKNCFDSLGNKSIGDSFLFKKDHINRSEFYVKKCSSDTVKDKLNLINEIPQQMLWVRASIFILDIEHQLLIEEFFMHMPPV